LRLQRVQHVDLSTDYERGLQRLRNTLAGPDAASERANAQPRATLDLPKPGVRWAWGYGAGIAALVALAAGGGALWVAHSRPRADVEPTPRPPVTLAASADLPAFMTHPITEADLTGKSTWELDVMRNEIYARHGRRFARSDLQSYFSAQPWYRPLYAPDEFPTSLLSAAQKRNIELIQRYQQRLAQ
jgi:hypothetical protein